MKAFLLLILCLSGSFCRGQQIALISTDLKSPIIYTDSVTAHQVSSGYFPVDRKDFDTLYANLKHLEGVLSTRSRSKMASFEMRSGATLLTVSAVPKAYGDHYDAVLGSRFGEIQANYYLTKETNNQRNRDRVRNLINYLYANQSLFKKAYEIHPRIYNIVLVKE